ncbi:MAG: hypothetical protein ACE5JT_05060 [Nitrosopumilaceae archaeon]
MDESEHKVRQEDCSEDSLGSGILTLTNKRVAFDKARGRILDFSKKMGDTVLDIPLSDVIEVGKEGWLIKKVWIKAKTNEREKTYKFGVFSNGSWLDTLQETLEEYKNQ